MICLRTRKLPEIHFPSLSREWTLAAPNPSSPSVLAGCFCKEWLVWFSPPRLEIRIHPSSCPTPRMGHKGSRSNQQVRPGRMGGDERTETNGRRRTDGEERTETDGRGLINWWMNAIPGFPEVLLSSTLHSSYWDPWKHLKAKIITKQIINKLSLA